MSDNKELKCFMIGVLFSIGILYFLGASPADLEELLMPKVDQVNVDVVENGKYESELGLPNIDDEQLKSGPVGKELKSAFYVPEGSENCNEGYIYITDRIRRSLDGVVITKLMYISVNREQSEEEVTHGDTKRMEICEKIVFRVEENKIVEYSPKHDSFYVKNGSIKFTALKVNVKSLTEDKTVLTSVSPYTRCGPVIELVSNEDKHYAKTYDEQIERGGLPKREAIVDFGDYELYKKGDYAELRVKFYSPKNNLESKVSFIIDDPVYGQLEEELKNRNED